MLAASGPIRGLATDYAFEPKWDGWRASVTVHDGRVILRTRTGRDVTEGVPELQPLADALEGRSVVLDGELVADDGAPLSFYRVGSRVASRRDTSRARAVPLTLVVFDLLYLDGDLASSPYRHRRALLDELRLEGHAWCTTPSYEATPELFSACAQLGLEGLVAKRLEGPYLAGRRSNLWVKAKCDAWLRDHAQYRHEREPRRHARGTKWGGL